MTYGSCASRAKSVSAAWRAAVFATLLLAPGSVESQASSTPPATAPVAAPVVARVFGVAFDSIAMRPLVGAMVQLVAADDPTRVRSATSDGSGLFSMDSVTAGTYLLGFFHPRLDSLNTEAPLLRVDVRTNGEIRTPIAIPSAYTIISSVCGPTMAQDSGSLFMGHVRSARGEPLSGPARIRAQWNEVTVSTRGVERRTPSHVVTTSAAGAFAICGLPADGSIMARASAGSDSSGFVDLPVPRNRLILRDVYVGAATRVASTASDPRSTSILRGSGVLRGTVKNPAGQPIRGARLVLWGSGRDDSTNASGQFAMQSLPSGTYTLEARAIGFAPMRVAVDVPEGSEGTTELAMEAFVPTVDTVRVRADRTNRLDQLADFESRRKSGFGYFIDEAYLNRRNAMFMSDLLRMAPGVTIQPAGSGFGDRITFRDGGTQGACVPAIFLNGVQMAAGDGNLDSFVNPQDVRAVEIYARTASVPAQFQTQNGCGALVIWTGARRPTPR